MLSDDMIRAHLTGAVDTSDMLRMLLEDYGVTEDDVESVDFDNWTVTLKAAERPLYDSEGCYFERETL